MRGTLSKSLAIIAAFQLGGCKSTMLPSLNSAVRASAEQASATLAIHLTWPRQTQALPSAVQSVSVLLRSSGRADQTTTVNAGGPTTVTFAALPPGSGYTIYAASYAGTGGTGAMLSWGSTTLSLTSGTNTLNLGLSVTLRPGTGADSLITGPGGNQAQQVGAQSIFTSMSDFLPGVASNSEIFYPGQYAYLSTIGGTGTGNGQFVYPDGVDSDAQGNIYVADRFNCRVEKFDPGGNFLRGWGEGQVWTTGQTPPATASGTANGWFNRPIGVSVDFQGNVWVADNVNARLQKFDGNGNFLMGVGNGSAWFAPTAAPTPVASNCNAGFNDLHGLLCDPAGNVWVGDHTNARVQRLGPNGDFQLAIGNGTVWQAPTVAPTPVASDAFGYFNGGYALDQDAAGNLYVSERENGRIQKFASNGAFVARYPHSLGYGLTLSPAGGFIASYQHDSASCTIDVMSSTGAVLSSFGNSGTGNGQFGNIRLMRFAKDGTLLVSDAVTNRVQRFQGPNLTSTSGGIRLTGYRQPATPTFAASGTYETPGVDSSNPGTAWGTAFWNVAALPAGTGVSADVATSSDGLNWGAWRSVAVSSSVGNNVSALSSIVGRYLKVRVSLTSSNPASSPEVQEVGVTY